MKTNKRLLFIYNANSGAMNGLLDYGKKYLNPSEYDCQLCMLSYGPFGMKKDWKKFTSSLPYPVNFLHIDELKSQYSFIKTNFPALVLLSENQQYSVLIDSNEFKDIQTLDDLKKKVVTVLETKKTVD